jgi:DNA-binding transcriptional MerR regulator
LLAIRKWKTAGLSLERIQEILAGDKNADQNLKPIPPPRPKKTGSVEVWSHLYVSDGIELQIEPGRAGLSPEQVRALFREVTNFYDKLKKGEK